MHKSIPAVHIQPDDQTSQLDSLQESAQLQLPQKFAMGMSPDSMLADLLKYYTIRYGNDDIMLDATCGTNHLKMPLYTGRVIDEYGNGLLGFMTLCQGISQADISQRLKALLQRLREHNSDWMSSCAMVDDAIAEINAIR